MNQRLENSAEPHPMTNDPKSDEFSARRMAAREALSAIDPHVTGVGDADPLRRDWFNAVYDTAAGDPAKVPWADLAPHPLLTEWLRAAGGAFAGVKALDIGCGLGDNAEELAAAGCMTSAFDLVPRAVEWARDRFPATTVDYRVADLFNLPADWRGAFTFAHECYTLQALPEELIVPGAAAIAGALHPGGLALVIARARAEDSTRSGPPWPLTRTNLAAFEAAGLQPISIEERMSEDRLHWRALFAKPIN
jgi:SAM-dependent methyltransferase